MKITDRTALVAGATGLIGSQLIPLLSGQPAYREVITLSRRKIEPTDPKIKAIVVDFDRLEESLPTGRVDDLFLCLGTTTAETSDRSVYRKIDIEYPVLLAQLALKAGATRCFVVTALKADPNSFNWFLRLKGETEQELAKVGLSELHAFRPSLLGEEKERIRGRETIALGALKFLKPLFVGSLADYLPIEGLAVAKAMTCVAIHPLSEKHMPTRVMVYNRKEMLTLADEFNQFELI